MQYDKAKHTTVRVYLWGVNDKLLKCTCFVWFTAEISGPLAVRECYYFKDGLRGGYNIDITLFRRVDNINLKVLDDTILALDAQYTQNVFLSVLSPANVMYVSASCGLLLVFALVHKHLVGVLKYIQSFQNLYSYLL